MGPKWSCAYLKQAAMEPSSEMSPWTWKTLLRGAALSKGSKSWAVTLQPAAVVPAVS